MEMTKEMGSVLQSIKDGEVYAHIESVTAGRMSRRILFYRVVVSYNDQAYEKPRIERITAEIGWLSGYLKARKYEQHGKFVNESGLLVHGVGTDMIFHTLYRCIPRAEKDKWSQKYNTL